MIIKSVAAVAAPGRLGADSDASRSLRGGRRAGAGGRLGAGAGGRPYPLLWLRDSGLTDHPPGRASRDTLFSPHRRQSSADNPALPASNSLS